MTDPDSSRDNVKLVVVEKATNTIEAELILSLLESAGIPGMIDGRFLQDEFAMPQKMLGIKGVKVCVREVDLEEARRVLADTRAPAEDDAPDDKPEDDGA